jgi:2-polyprenyl-6-methoxyphenol hydroxylase-like FAD-dependent oxidoreductase
MLTASILIVGSGPIGLWLAYELRRTSNLDVLVIDTIPSKEKRNKYSKALSISAGALETFESRGVASRFLELGIPMYKTHFAGTLVDLNANVLGARHSHNLMIPQAQTEGVLLALCEDVGVRFGWGMELCALSQDGEGVSVTTRRLTEAGFDEGENLVIRAGWVVGCDGTHSRVRELVGIAFEGTASTMSCTLADIQLSDKPTGILKSATGSSIVPIGDGVHHRFVSAMEPIREAPVSSQPPTLEQVRQSLHDTFGSDFGAHSPLWFSCCGNACRVASSFRIEKVLLAGDAGHQIFPAGGQGMNLGFQDATSLAWRLAMVADRSFSSEDAVQRILESYSRERCTAANAVSENVQAQMALLAAETPPELALRAVFREALKTPELNALWARRLTGFGDPKEAFAYMPLSSANSSLSYGPLLDSLVGTRVTSRICGSGMEELFRATTPKRFVFLWMTEEAEVGKQDFKAVLDLWAHKVTVLSMTAENKGLKDINALLVRPDMRIAWVARSELAIAKCQSDLVAVLGYWFGSQ